MVVLLDCVVEVGRPQRCGCYGGPPTCPMVLDAVLGARLLQKCTFRHVHVFPELLADQVMWRTRHTCIGYFLLAVPDEPGGLVVCGE